MRVVFMGTPEFAVPSLRALSGAHEVVAVFTRPDSASGRGAKTRPSPVKSAALELGIPVLQPTTLRDAEQAPRVRELQADLIVVAAYGLILPLEALQSARLGAVNVHASLLPRWRGAAPIQRAILAGDEIVGISIMRMEVGLDIGPYCAQVQTPVAGKNAVELTCELAELGAAALVSAIPSIAEGTAAWTVQDDLEATYANKVTKADVGVSPRLGVAEVVRRVRASLPTAPSRVLLGGRGATLLSVEVATRVDVPPGTVDLTKSELLLGAADGAVRVINLKPDGKAAMDASAWARGVRDIGNATWEAAR